jgi:hypothetical protein
VLACLFVTSISAAYVAAGLPDFSWCNIPKREKYTKLTLKCTKWPQYIPNGRKIDQMAIKYTNIFRCKSLKNLPKRLILVRKNAIWQPCVAVAKQA